MVVSLRKSSITEEKLGQIRKLNELANSRGQSLASMALSWVLKDDPITSVIIGASKSSQILDNINALEHLTFTADELSTIDSIIATS